MQNLATLAANRRDFLKRASLVLVVPMVPGLVSACGDDADDGAAGPTFVATGQGSGHTHIVTITCAALSSGSDASFNSSTDDGHQHVLRLTAAQFATLSSGGTVDLTTADLHVHTWSISADNAC